MSILSTREWAAIIWSIIVMIYILCHKAMRERLWRVIVIFFGKRLRILWGIILLYNITITIPLCRLSVWDNIYIKDIVIWVLFSGFVYCINAVSSNSDETYIKKIAKDNLKLTIFLEFFMSTFTFDIWIEILIIPVIVIITIMNEIAKSKDEYRTVHKFLDVMMAVFGFWILYNTVKIGLSEYKDLNLKNTLISFMIPFVYLILTTPLVFALELYSKYEVLFTRMNFYEEAGVKIKIQHRIAIIGACGISIRKICLFQREYLGKMYRKMEDLEFKRIIAEFKKLT